MRSPIPDFPISIHALRVEGDHGEKSTTFYVVYFYPRPPGGGRRFGVHRFYVRKMDFYPRPPGGGRPHMIRHSYRYIFISIHALRVEGDGFHFNHTRGQLLFLSTPSGWRATIGASCTAKAPRFLSTPSGWRATTDQNAPFGTKTPFLSTPSGWRATLPPLSCPASLRDFYPRPPGGGRRPTPSERTDPPCNFYPRPPGGGRRPQPRQNKESASISIHALRVEGDRGC